MLGLGKLGLGSEELRLWRVGGVRVVRVEGDWSCSWKSWGRGSWV